MGTSLDTDDVILIPGIPTFRKSVVPPLSIRLPIVASCSRSKYVLMAIFFLFCAFGMLVTMLTFFVDDAENKIPLAENGDGSDPIVRALLGTIFLGGSRICIL